MDYSEVIEATKQQCCKMASVYRQDACELLSFCLTKLPGLVSRIDTSKPPRQQLSYVKRSITGYCLHYLRDHATLIRTPRGNLPFKVSELTPLLGGSADTTLVDTLPDWATYVLEECTDTTLVKRFANAYLATYYPA
jgi:hypothetical protein